MKLLSSLTTRTSTSTSLTLSAAQKITHSLARRAAVSAALILATGLAACGEEEMTSTPEISQTEAMISASDVSVEDLDLQTLALSASGEVEVTQVCRPQNLIARGRRHHPHNQNRDEGGAERNQVEFEDQDMTEDREASEDQQARGRERGPRGQRGQQRRQRRPHPRRALILMAYDADGDGQLSEEERSVLAADLIAGCEAQHARILEAFDADGSGDLDEDEMALARETFSAHREARRELRQERRETHRTELREEFDADGDGELNREERQTAREAMRTQRRARLIAKFDVDGDGELSEEELETLAQTVRERIQSGQRAEPEADEEE